jgi:Tfp pilus assembly major pilin PilA
MMVYIGILAAVSIPAYQGYVNKAKLDSAVSASTPVREGLASYYLSTQKVPPTLNDASLPEQLADGSQLSLNPDNMALTIKTKLGALVFTPKIDKQGRVFWVCANGEGLTTAQLPPACARMGN